MEVMEVSIYHPSPRVLDRLKKVNLVVVVGPTAVGKTTMTELAAARHPELRFVLGHTSREPRPGERNGVDYDFKTRAGMEERIKQGSYVQVAPSLFGDLYATAPEDYPTEGVAVLAVLSEVVPLFHSLPFKSLRVVFVVPSSWQEWQRRLKSHNFSLAHLSNRMREAHASLQFALKDQNLQFVISGAADLSAEDFATIALNKPWPERLKADQAKAKLIARELLKKI